MCCIHFLLCCCAIRYLKMPSSTLLMTPMREKKTLVFATISTVSLLFCSQAFGAIASRPFLSNETTVCQRQQRRHTHTRDAKKTGKIAIIKSICKQEKKSKAGRFIAQDYQEIAKYTISRFFLSTILLDTKW